MIQWACGFVSYIDTKSTHWFGLRWFIVRLDIFPLIFAIEKSIWLENTEPFFESHSKYIRWFWNWLNLLWRRMRPSITRTRHHCFVCNILNAHSVISSSYEREYIRFCHFNCHFYGISVVLICRWPSLWQQKKNESYENQLFSSLWWHLMVFEWLRFRWHY